MNEDIRNPEYFAKCIAEGLKKGIEKGINSEPIPELVSLCKEVMEKAKRECDSYIHLQ